ncbi:hypothetical protein [Micromonospora sp. NPDC005710]
MGEEDIVGVLDVLIGHKAMELLSRCWWVGGGFIGSIGHRGSRRVVS